jgi:hypothetical protein
VPDTRPSHVHHPGPARSLYGPSDPQQAPGKFIPRPLSTKIDPRKLGLAPAEPPQSIAEHVTATIAKIPDLTPRQRNSVAAAVLAMTRDISFIHHIMRQMPSAPASDEGRIL